MERNDFMRPLEIRHPLPPESLVFACREIADAFELRMARTPEERGRVFERLKKQASRKLAAFVMENCKFFEVPDLMSDDMRLHIEVTINDRGAYENWLPVAEQRARREGERKAVTRMVESLPYGLADAAREFYE